MTKRNCKCLFGTKNILTNKTFRGEACGTDGHDTLKSFIGLDPETTRNTYVKEQDRYLNSVKSSCGEKKVIFYGRELAKKKLTHVLCWEKRA